MDGLQLWKATIIIKQQGYRVNEAGRGLWRPLVWPPAQSRVHQEVGPGYPRLYPVGSWKSLIGATEGWLWRASAPFLDRVKHYGTECSHSVSTGTMQLQRCCPITKPCTSHLAAVLFVLANPHLWPDVTKSNIVPWWLSAISAFMKRAAEGQGPLFP